jgi:hypothetical protein
MNRNSLSAYSEFLQLKGHRVIQTPSSLWIDVRPSVFQIAPPFDFDHIQQDEANEVFKSKNVLVCRWFSARNGESSQDVGSPMIYIAHPPYDLEHLEQKARNQTRRGLERVEVRKMALDETTERLAYSVYRDNVKRLGLIRGEQQIKAKWQSWVKAITKASCVEFWTAWHERSLVAFTVTVQTELGTELVMQRSAHSALALYPNNALVYTVTRDAFERGSKLVSFGLSSFAGEKEGLHRFKVNMNFKAVTLCEHQLWHPWVRPLSPFLNPQRLRNAYQSLSRIVAR